MVIRAGCTALALASFSFPCIAQDNPASIFTNQLTALFASFDKVNEVVVGQMDSNERRKLAVSMLRLSSGFYALMAEKTKFDEMIEKQPSSGGVDYSALSSGVEKLQRAVQCFSREFRKIGPELAALNDINGIELEQNLRRGLEDKVDSLNQIVRDLGMTPKPGEDPKATIVADGKKAAAAAEHLFQISIAFAKKVDPHAPMPPPSELCIALPPT